MWGEPDVDALKLTATLRLLGGDKSEKASVEGVKSEMASVEGVTSPPQTHKKEEESKKSEFVTVYTPLIGRKCKIVNAPIINPPKDEAQLADEAEGVESKDTDATTDATTDGGTNEDADEDSDENADEDTDENADENTDESADENETYIGEAGPTVDAFGISLTTNFDCMDPIGSTQISDLGTIS
jgi:hypothetical protein